MKRFSTLLGRKGSPSNAPTRDHIASDLAPADSPEGTASRAVRIFCESGSASNRDEEVLQLPTIVDAAESSPGAAAACAAQIRNFMQKQYSSKPHVQYNAIMLIRILSDNPGATFTKNFDDKFVKVTKHLLRDSRDHSIQQLLRETLDSLEANRAHDTGTHALMAMWRREKGMGQRLDGGRQPDQRMPPSSSFAGAPQTMLNHDSQRSRNRTHLPPPVELASRIEESRNTAKILVQFLQSTPADEVSSNELIKEFADRCQTAQRSMQGYINCENPAPDDDTLQTLIETNEQLSLANSRYQRAVLAARRALGVSSSPNMEGQNPAPMQNNDNRIFAPLPQVPQTNGFGTFQNGTHYGQKPNTTTTVTAEPVSPPTRHAQPNLSISQPTAQHEDYDDLYDSPRATRPPAADNPFSDPADHARVSPPLSASTYSTHNSNYAATDHGHGASPARSSFNVSPTLTQSRPTPAPWHNSIITPSFLGRQASAADGLTMHAPGTPGAAELDNHSNVGRTDFANRSQPQTSFTVNHGSPVMPSGGFGRAAGV